MKIAGFLLFVAVAVVAASAAPCNTAALGKLLADGNVRACGADSGYNPTSTTMPTDAQVAAVCKSGACMKTIDAVKQVAPDECTIGPWRLHADMLDPISQRCSSLNGSGSVAGSASANNSVGTAAGSASAPESAVGDKASASAGKSGSATKSPAKNTQRPSATTPTPSSLASERPMLSTFMTAVVLAVAVGTIL